MANYNTLITAIQQVIKTNGNEEITGALLQQSLLSMISSLGAGYQFIGVATPSTNPGTPDQRIFYVAGQVGTYTNFSGITISDGELGFLYFDTEWHKSSVSVGGAIDDHSIAEVKLANALIAKLFQTGYKFVGTATTATNPGTPGQNVFYVTATAGTYTRFGNIVVNDGELAFLYFDTEWHKTSINVNDADAVHFTPQTLTDEQKAQARQNIGATNTQIVNDLTTGGADKALSAEQGKLIANIISAKWQSGKIYDIGDIAIYNSQIYRCIVANSDLTFNATKWLISSIQDELRLIIKGYIKSRSDFEISLIKNGMEVTNTSIGTAIQISSTYTDYGYVKIPVKAGDKYVIRAAVGVAFRIWHFTDENDIVVDVAAGNTMSYEMWVEAPQDGYLYVTNKFTSIASPIVNKYDYYKFGYDSVVADNNAYVNTIGDEISSYTTNSKFRSKIYPITQGARITIKTYGGSGSARAWALCDTDKQILDTAESGANYLVNPAELTALQDGYIVVNADKSNLPTGFEPQFTITYPSVRQPSIELHTEQIEQLQEDVEKLKPLVAKKIKILCVGNSFSSNMTEMIPQLLRNIDITKDNDVTIYQYVVGSASLSNWWQRFVDDDDDTAQKVMGETLSVGNTLKQGFANDWDYIVFQQLSNDSDNFNTFEPYLSNLITNARKLCTNPKVKIAWQLTWPRISSSTGSGAPVGTQGFADIVTAVKSMFSYYNGIIDVIIPSGTSVMNARGNATLNNDGELSNDGRHLADGVGKYMAACSMYMALLQDFVGKKLETSTITTSFSESLKGVKNVTDANRALCHLAVQYAIVNPFNISTLAE